MASPYENIPKDQWLKITQDLVEEHPLKVDIIAAVAIKAWSLLWQTRLGEGEAAVALSDLDAPATVIGYFFEILFARELEVQFPDEWRRGKSKDEKDLVYIPDSKYSVEMKTSGQLGTKIFGNRSYNQASADEEQVVKTEKSGFYITVNFHKQVLTLLRFGWIDKDDWAAQASSTGQAASLNKDVYQYKLLPVKGDYRLNAPVGIMEGVGPKKVALFTEEGITSLADLLLYKGTNRTILTFQARLAENFELQDSVKD